MADLYVAADKKERKKAKEKTAVGEVLKSLELVRTKNPLAALLVTPSGTRFEAQNSKEQIILLLRKHWITNLRWLLISFALLVAPPFLLRFFPFFSLMPTRFQFFSVIVWYLLILVFILEQFLSWFFDVCIVTNQRIIDIDFYHLLYKQRAEAKNDRIQDVTLRRGGVARTLFNYGDVLIQTAGAQPNLEFEAVPKPNSVVRVLQELRAQQEKGRHN